MKQAKTIFDWSSIYHKCCDKSGALNLSIDSIIELGKLLEKEAKKGTLKELYKQKKHKSILNQFIHLFKEAVYDTSSFLFVFSLFTTWGNTEIKKQKLCEIIPSIKTNKP